MKRRLSIMWCNLLTVVFGVPFFARLRLRAFVGSVACFVGLHSWGVWRYAGIDWRGKHWHVRDCFRCSRRNTADGSVTGWKR